MQRKMPTTDGERAIEIRARNADIPFCVRRSTRCTREGKHVETMASGSRKIVRCMLDMHFHNFARLCTGCACGVRHTEIKGGAKKNTYRGKTYRNASVRLALYGMRLREGAGIWEQRCGKER